MKKGKILLVSILSMSLFGCTNQSKQDLLNYEDKNVLVVSKKIDNQIKILVQGKSTDALNISVNNQDKVIETHSSIYKDDYTLFIVDASKYNQSDLKVHVSKSSTPFKKVEYSVEGIKTNQTDHGMIEVNIKAKSNNNVGEVVYLFRKNNTNNVFDDAVKQDIKMDTNKTVKYTFDGVKYKTSLGKGYSIKTYVRLTGAK